MQCQGEWGNRLLYCSAFWCALRLSLMGVWGVLIRGGVWFGLFLAFFDIVVD